MDGQPCLVVNSLVSSIKKIAFVHFVAIQIHTLFLGYFPLKSADQESLATFSRSARS